MGYYTQRESAAIEQQAQAVTLATQEYFARGYRIERALRIAMVYLGLAEWRKRDRARLEIVERGPTGDLALLTTSKIEIRCDGVRAWSLVVEMRSGRPLMHSERWHGRLDALNEAAPIAPMLVG